MKSSLTKTVAATCFIFALTLGAQAAEFFQNASMNPGAHWNEAYWTNAANPSAIIPSAGNTYVNDVGATRTAAGEDFLGDSLTLRSGRSLNLKHSGTVTVDLVMEDGSTMANGGSTGGMDGTLTGSGAVTLNVSDLNGRPITLNSLLKSDNTFSEIKIIGGGPNDVALVDAANTFTGVWNNVSGGALKGVGFGKAAGFSIGSSGALDFNADYVNSNAYLNLLAGGSLVLDQDLLFDTVDLGLVSLTAGTYTASALWADPDTSNAIDAASNPGSTLTVLTDPTAHKIAYFDFNATNGVSADVYAYSDVGNWDLSNAGTGAAYTNATYPEFNGMANVVAINVPDSIDPTTPSYHAFTLTVQDLPAGKRLYLGDLTLDYVYRAALGFRLLIYTSVTGQNPDTFTTGDTAIYDNSLPNSSTTILTEEVDVALDAAAFQGLENGDSIEFRVVLSDGSGSASRVHGIDNVVLTAYHDDAQPTFGYVASTPLRVSSSTNFHVSVFPGAASYEGVGTGGGTGTIGDGTVVDYAFYNASPVTGFGPYTLNKYASGAAGLISDAVATYQSGSQNTHVEVWTTTDPGVGFSTTPDYGYSFAAAARASHLTNTVNISKYQSGTVYVLYGSFLDATTNVLTMSGPGLPDISVTNTAAHGSNDYYMDSFEFAGAADYTTITAVHENGDLDASPASRARYLGIIFDGVLSPPKGTVIIVK